VLLATKTGLLTDQHFDEDPPVFLFLQFHEHGRLRFGHGTANAMLFALDFADIDTRAWGFARLRPLKPFLAKDQLSRARHAQDNSSDTSIPTKTIRPLSCGAHSG